MTLVFDKKNFEKRINLPGNKTSRIESKKVRS